VLKLESAQGWIAQPAAAGGRGVSVGGEGGYEAKSPGQAPGPGWINGWTDTHTRQNLYILTTWAVNRDKDGYQQQQ